MSRGIEWSRFGDCGQCGARAGAKCFGTNGARKLQACASRPYTADGVRGLLKDFDAKLEADGEAIRRLANTIARQQKQIDLLLGGIEEA